MAAAHGRDGARVAEAGDTSPATGAGPVGVIAAGLRRAWPPLPAAIGIGNRDPAASPAEPLRGCPAQALDAGRADPCGTPNTGPGGGPSDWERCRGDAGRPVVVPVPAMPQGSGRIASRRSALRNMMFSIASGRIGRDWNHFV